MAQKAQKRRQRAQRLLNTLVEYLEKNSGTDADVESFLRAMQQWLVANLRVFTPDQLAAYKLGRLATDELSTLPTMYADFDPAVELSQLRNIPPGSISTVGMWIGTMFWEGTTIWASRDCPQCDSGMRVMQEAGNPENLAYECDVCTWVEDEDGAEWPLDGNIERATTDALRRHGLLPPGG